MCPPFLFKIRALLFSSLVLLCSLFALSLFMDSGRDLRRFAPRPAAASLEALLADQKAPLYISLYRCAELDQNAASQRELNRLLSSFARRGPYPVYVERRDPCQDEQLLRDLSSLGGRSLRSNTSTGEGSFQELYSALLVEYRGDFRFVPWVDSPLELALASSKAIESLLKGRQDLVSLIVPGEDLELVTKLIQDSGRAVRSLSVGDQVPPESDSLFVLGDIDTIDQGYIQSIASWIEGGGPCFFALDIVRVDLSAGSAVRDSILLENPPLLDLLNGLGLGMEALLVHDLEAVEIASERSAPGGTVQTSLERYPWWPRTAYPSAPESRGGESPAFIHGGLELFWASPLSFDVQGPSRAGVLVRSSPESRLPPLPWYLHPAELFLNQQSPALGPQTLGLWLETPNREGTGRLVLIGDAQIAGALSVRNDALPSRNAVFILDALDWIEGRDILAAIRSPLHRLHALEDRMNLGSPRVASLFIPLSLPLFLSLILLLWPRIRALRLQTSRAKKERIGE